MTSHEQVRPIGYHGAVTHQAEIPKAGQPDGYEQVEKAASKNGRLHTIPDVLSGLGLMPRSWALRIAHVARRLTSSHA